MSKRYRRPAPCPHPTVLRLHRRKSSAPGPRCEARGAGRRHRATRAEVGDTVEALSQKFDLKAQARYSLDDAKQRVTAQAQIAQARGVEVFQQARDAATDDHGNLPPQARSIAVKVAALVICRVAWKKVWR